MTDRRPTTRTSDSSSCTIRSLDASTWEAFAELVERNNGIYGECWCIAFHSCYQRGVSDPRSLKKELVRAGRAHAALVFDAEDRAQGWCQYGTPDELDLKHAREYRKDPPAEARWRITCIFVDRRHRGQGVARAALEGALPRLLPQEVGWSKRYPRPRLGATRRAGSSSARPSSCSSSTASSVDARSASTPGS